MTGSGADFDPGIEASAGVWPQRPDLWSYSSLKEVEACPRRWMLTRAQYPDLWSRSGYPMMPVIAAVFGDVVHSSLEAILKALVAAGCESTRVAGAAHVLRELGGITAVVEHALKDRLARLVGNPRLNRDRGRRVGRELSDRVPEARAQVQAYLSRIVLPAGSQPKRAANPDGGNTCSRSCPQRRPVGTGSHPEITLTADEVRLTGRVDLLTVADDVVRITDYKTGVEDPGHLDQLHTYALLWDLDRAVNPSGRKVTDLMAAYPSREVSIPGPGEEELRVLQQSFETRIAAADAEVAAPMPAAVTREDTCGFCQVRQLCAEYWEQIVPGPDSVPPGDWFDYQGIVGQRNGVRSWWMMSSRTGGRELLLRTPLPATELTSGSQIRVLGIRLDDDPEVEALVGAMSASSEVFVLNDRR
ncbi:PD-(D/E)XK nuclease family protein [Micromonospora sp. CPCC 205711]|uniref:PD-(D/E)XK nuclease family protein n=1 Tax=Micromonospora sp. CPCC 205547 TaxID=3122400 RepID=UPI002FEF9E64